MPDNLMISLLLDFYGPLLTEKQQQSIDYYYNHDLSLAEIAQHADITRQGVRDSIKRAEAQLFEYEEKLGLLQRFHKRQQQVETIVQAATSIQEENQKFGKSPVLEEQVQIILDTASQLNS